MKKLQRSVLILGMVISLVLLSACSKAGDGSNTEGVETTAAEIETEEKAAPEPTEAPKEEKADPTKTDEKEELSTVDTAKADDTKAEETASVSLNDVYNRIAGSVSLPEMYFADEGFMLNYYGIDSSKLDDYVFASSMDSTRADSVILIRLKDESSADEVVGGLNMLLEQMNAELENYNPEANELVKAAKVRRNGKNIDLVIHSDRNTILSIIDSSL